MRYAARETVPRVLPYVCLAQVRIYPFNWGKVPEALVRSHTSLGGRVVAKFQDAASQNTALKWAACLRPSLSLRQPVGVQWACGEYLFEPASVAFAETMKRVHVAHVSPPPGDNKSPLTDVQTLVEEASATGELKSITDVVLAAVDACTSPGQDRSCYRDLLSRVVLAGGLCNVDGFKTRLQYVLPCRATLRCPVL